MDRRHGLSRIAGAYAAQGWPAEARDGALYAPYSAPSGGPPPWHTYELTLATVFAFAATAPGGATRFRF